MVVAVVMVGCGGSDTRLEEAHEPYESGDPEEHRTCDRLYLPADPWMDRSERRARSNHNFKGILSIVFDFL